MKERIEELRKLISEYDKLYYIEHKSVVSDFEYDQLYHDWCKLESEYLNLMMKFHPRKKYYR